MISVQALVFPLFSAQEWWGRPTIHLSLTLQKDWLSLPHINSLLHPTLG